MKVFMRIKPKSKQIVLWVKKSVKSQEAKRRAGNMVTETSGAGVGCNEYSFIGAGFFSQQ